MAYTKSGEYKTRIQNKHDTEASWIKAENFIPFEGEIIVYDIEVDANGNIIDRAYKDVNAKTLPNDRTMPYTHTRFKIGNGIKNVNELPFAGTNIYMQDSAPVDVDIGSLWVDTSVISGIDAEELRY